MQTQIEKTKTEEHPLTPIPKVTEEIIKLGGEKLLQCYQCGSCTAVCPVSEEYNTSFRRSIKYAQLGLEKKILSDEAPWLCHACGDCTLTCPRDGKPTSILAAIRRYLVTKYDWTGLSKRFYLSKKFEIMGIILLALITGLGALFLHGPIITDRVALETFAPLEIVETAGILVFVVLASILLSNIYRAYKFTMIDLPKGAKITFSDYIKEFFKLMPLHFLTQKSMKSCEEDRNYWAVHLMIFYGYGLSFALFVVFLRFVQTDLPFLFVNPLSIIGIIATVLLLAGTGVTIYGRLKKSKPIWEQSHPTDWVFIILMLATVVTGLLTGIFRTLGYPLHTYITFTIHLMLAAPFLILEVPFGKWSHLAYRPFAIYFHRLKERALKNYLNKIVTKPLYAKSG